MKVLLLLLTIAFSTVTSWSQVKSPTPAPVKPAFEKSMQIVVVTAKDWDATTGTARLYERKNAKASWKANGESFPVVLGRSGMAVGDVIADPKTAKVKKEGDGNSPAGVFPLIATFGRGSKPNAVEMDHTILAESTECIDDTRSSHYNRVVDRFKVGNFDWKSSEKMAAIDQYALGVIVGYNSYPVEKGHGSCIFLHIWRDASTATEGCTAMERRNVERIVGWLSPDKTPYLVQMPEKLYSDSRKAWRLPKLK